MATQSLLKLKIQVLHPSLSSILLLLLLMSFALILPHRWRHFSRGCGGRTPSLLSRHIEFRSGEYSLALILNLQSNNKSVTFRPVGVSHSTFAFSVAKKLGSSFPKGSTGQKLRDVFNLTFCRKSDLLKVFW